MIAKSKQQKKLGTNQGPLKLADTVKAQDSCRTKLSCVVENLDEVIRSNPKEVIGLIIYWTTKFRIPRDDVDDYIQEIYMHIFKVAHKYYKPELGYTASTYLSKMIRSTINRIRKKKRVKFVPVPEVVIAVKSTRDKLIEEEEIGRLRKEVSCEDLEIIIHRFGWDWTYKQLSTLGGVTPERMRQKLDAILSNGREK